MSGWKPLNNNDGGNYSPPRVAPDGGVTAASADPFVGSDAFGAAGEFRPPTTSSSSSSPAGAASAAASAGPYGAFDGGATFGGSGSGRSSPTRGGVGGGGGGRGAPPPPRGNGGTNAAAAVPAVVPFNDTAVPSVPTAASSPPPSKNKGSSSSTSNVSAGASGSGNNNNGGGGGGGGRAALLGGASAPSTGALGGTNNDGDPSSSSNSKASVFSLRRHRSHFNVDTSDVLSRMRDSVVCIFKPDFLERVGASPDLYGPFWIATTLVFLSAVAGNVAAWASWKRAHGGGSSGGSSPSEHPAAWLYDVDKVGFSAILFYGYIFVVGGALFATMRFVFRAPISSDNESNTPAITLPAVWCAYGYSLTPFIPVSMLAVIPNEAARWSLIAVAAAASGCFLLLNFRGSVYGCAGPKALPTTVAMGCAHAGLAVALKLYIFHYWK